MQERRHPINAEKPCRSRLRGQTWLGLGLCAASVLPFATPLHSRAGMGQNAPVLGRAEKLAASGEAAARYQVCARTLPRQAIVFRDVGLAYQRQGRFPAAREAFGKAVQCDPHLASAQVDLGIELLRANQLDEAETSLETAILIDPKDAQAHLHLGRYYSGRGQYREALRELCTASILRPKDPEILYHLGQVYGKAAAAAYLEMAEADPDSFRLHQVFAETYDAQRNTAKAIEEYQAAIDRSPNMPGLHYALGDVLWRALKFQEAQAEFLQELKLSPQDYLSMWKIGNILLYDNRWDEAMGWIEKAIAIDPQLAQAHRDLGKAYFQKNELAKAVAEYQKVVQLAPEEDSVHYRLAIIYRRLGRENEAKAEMEAFERLNQKARRADHLLAPGTSPDSDQPRAVSTPGLP